MRGLGVEGWEDVIIQSEIANLFSVFRLVGGVVYSPAALRHPLLEGEACRGSAIGRISFAMSFAASRFPLSEGGRGESIQLALR